MPIKHKKTKKKPRKKLRYQSLKRNKSPKIIKKTIENQCVSRISDESVTGSPDQLDTRAKVFGGNVDSYAYGLSQTLWAGMITIKFYDYEFYNNHKFGDGQQKRFKFAEELMKNLCSRTFRIKESLIKWIACDEVSIKEQGHIHILFSFDYLLEKGKSSKIPKLDFSNEKGDFFIKVDESARFLWKKLNKSMTQLEVDWRCMHENSGLVGYVCKTRSKWEAKPLYFSSFWRIHAGYTNV
jgi:hypothetical protein